MSSSKISSVMSSLISRRSYGVYARAVNVQQEAASAAAAAAVAPAKTDVAAAADAATSVKKTDKLFWMRDPKTGCWVPENQFQEVDVVDLRNRLTRHH